MQHLWHWKGYLYMSSSYLCTWFHALSSLNLVFSQAICFSSILIIRTFKMDKLTLIMRNKMKKSCVWLNLAYDLYFVNSFIGTLSCRFTVCLLSQVISRYKGAFGVHEVSRNYPPCLLREACPTIWVSSVRLFCCWRGIWMLHVLRWS
jgi:hypothetical protein